MFTVNDAGCTNQLETANKQRINNEQMVIFHHNGFTRTSLSATVTRVSNFVEENVFLILHPQGSPIPMHSVTHCQTRQICQSQCTLHVLSIE